MIINAVFATSTVLVRQIVLKAPMIHQTGMKTKIRILTLILSPLLSLPPSLSQILNPSLRQSLLLTQTFGEPGPAYRKFVTIHTTPTQATPELFTRSIASSISSKRSLSSSTQSPLTITSSEAKQNLQALF